MSEQFYYTIPTIVIKKRQFNVNYVSKHCNDIERSLCESCGYTKKLNIINTIKQRIHWNETCSSQLRQCQGPQPLFWCIVFITMHLIMYIDTLNM